MVKWWAIHKVTISPCAEKAPPGNYRARLRVTSDGLAPVGVTLRIRVRPVTIPAGQEIVRLKGPEN